MISDRVDPVLDDWSEEKPDLEIEALGIVLRIQVLEKSFADQVNLTLAELELESLEYDVLSALRRQGEPFQMSASEISEDLMLSPGALTNRIDRLISRDLVTRKEDPEDRRRVIISLTGGGITMVDKGAKARFDCAENAVSALTERQRGQLDGLLKKLLVDVEADD